jgi:SAM-dependent methyltransferase
MSQSVAGCAQMLRDWIRKSAIISAIRASIFPVAGHKVDSLWYTPYKFQQIKRVLQLPFDSSQLPRPYGRWLDERIVECPWLLSQLPAGPATLLDAGSALNHHFILRHPKLLNKSLTIMTLAPEADCSWRDGISYVYGDLRRTAFRDDYFDYIACLSTVEHIGFDNTLFYTADRGKAENDPEAYLAAILELWRILRPGGSLLLSVPFGMHSVRNWLQVFDGDMIDRMVATLQPPRHAEAYFRYSEPDGWRVSSRTACADAKYFDYHSDPAWPGSPAAAESVACLTFTK